MKSSGDVKTTLGEISDFINGGAWNQTEYSDEGIPVVRVTDIKRETVDLSDCKFLPKTALEKYSRHLLRRGDLVICTVGSHPTQPGSVVGRAAVIPASAHGTLLNKNAVCIRTASPKVDQSWLSYLGRSNEFHDYIISCARGSASQVRMAIGLLKVMPVVVPPLPTQQRIAGILSAYDELIENSQRRIKVLETMARALYHETLGTCSQASKPIPIVESPYWRFITENVSPYSGSKRYYATADIDGLSIIGQGTDFAYADKPSRAQKQPMANSVWFARMKDTYKIPWYGPDSIERVSDMVLSSGFAGFEAVDADLWPLLFLTISSKDFHVQKDLFCTGATQMALTNEGLARIKMPLPDESTARRLGQTAAPMLNQMAALQKRNENLRRTRDLLLPRLLSGQINVDLTP